MNKKCICQGLKAFSKRGILTINNNCLKIKNHDLSPEDIFEINFCPICGKKLDNRKEVPKELTIYKDLYKLMNGNCTHMNGGKEINGCKGCFYEGKRGKGDKFNPFYCNQIITILKNLNENYKLDK